MKNRPLVKFSAITVSFVVLIIGYVYFNQQSLLSSGKANAETIVQTIEDGDPQSVKNQLAEFVGGANPESDPEFQKALSSVDFVYGVVSTGEDMTFVGGELTSSGDHQNYGAAYELPAPQGGTDYFLITLRREGDAWLLANTQLAATNPFDESSN